jgi:hypothetical protein
VWFALKESLGQISKSLKNLTALMKIVILNFSKIFKDKNTSSVPG